MQMRRGPAVLTSLLTVVALGVSSLAGAAERDPQATGAAPEHHWVFGIRPGFSVLTQEGFANTGADVGFALNFQGLYAINSWFLAGLTLEWERRHFDAESPSLSLGTLNTVSLIPTVEVRPIRYGNLVPYASGGIGVNVNSFSESNQVGSTKISPDNTFAFRLAGGTDYFVTKRLALNTEIAWKRNRGGIDIGSVSGQPFDASSFNFLFGIRYTF